MGSVKDFDSFSSRSIFVSIMDDSVVASSCKMRAKDRFILQSRVMFYFSNKNAVERYDVDIVYGLR